MLIKRFQNEKRNFLRWKMSIFIVIKILMTPFYNYYSEYRFKVNPGYKAKNLDTNSIILW